jgi:ABC-2 type transport system permease protein
MRKFLAVVKREYVQRVRAKMFVLMTIGAPLLMAFFGIVPTLIFGLRPGGPVRIAVVDQTGKLYPNLEKAITSDTKAPPTPDAAALRNGDLDQAIDTTARPENNIELQEIQIGGRPLDVIRTELDGQIRSKQINGYVVLPAEVLNGERPQFFGSNTIDLFTKRTLQQTINRAIQERRLEEANIDSSTIEELSRPVELRAVRVGPTGEERDSGEGFLLVFGAGFVMYITILLYGQVVLGAIIEEKETRIAEILFSSVRPFTLMMGKLVGVSLVALTQLMIWGIAAVTLAVYGVNLLASRGMPMHIPSVPPTHFLYFILFFLLGYFVYSTIYAFVGSMVSTPQEGGQLAMPIILLLAVGFYLFLPVSSSPDSSFAFWVSMLPFFAPITMMVRITTQTPPFWEIALSFLLGVGTILLLTWIASRIYRIGMLMYGKKATIAEVIRWVRQP